MADKKRVGGTVGSGSGSGSHKRKIVIRKKNSRTKDISEHFKASSPASGRPFAQKSFRSPAANSRTPLSRRAENSASPAVARKAAYAANRPSSAKFSSSTRSNIISGLPPTAAQARGRTVRGHLSERGRHDIEKGKRQEEEHILEKPLEPKQSPVSSVAPRKISIMENIQVGELAKKLNLRPREVIGKLMRMGEMVTINKTIDAETATLLANEYNCEVNVISLYDETVIKEEMDQKEDRQPRPPVVTVMGHVDHGKTKLLDTIRQSNIVATEAGAITQHIGAYQVSNSHGKITFLDTPGHEAFTAMRARGASITDLVILVVAADDGVKRQTIEAIAHAREAKVPIIVAINKIDLPTADVERIKKELAAQKLVADSWGGDTIFCEISAKEGRGIDHLLEMILLQAEVLELRTNPHLRATGRVVEARVDMGKGPVATVLVRKGTLREGDSYVAGVHAGRVRAMFDDVGNKLKEALPAMPVEVTGMDGVPEAGDPFQVVESEKYGREIATKRRNYKQLMESREHTHPSLPDLNAWIKDHKELNIIIKADVQGSVEAIRDGLIKLSSKDVRVRVIHGATGAITDSDINLANASDAIIIGFQVRANSRVVELAQGSKVEIKYYSIIYNVVEDIKKAMEGMLEPDQVEEITGSAEVRQVFKISKVGQVAGCMVLSGNISRKQQVRLLRDNVVIHTGTISDLRRYKEGVEKVNEGFECGISLESYNDIHPGDQVEAFLIKEISRKL